MVQRVGGQGSSNKIAVMDYLNAHILIFISNWPIKIVEKFLYLISYNNFYYKLFFEKLFYKTIK